MNAIIENTKFVKLKESDVAGIPRLPRLDYEAPNARTLLAEVSLLQHEGLRHLSFLPPPTLLHIDPRNVEVRVPADVFVRKMDRTQLRQSVLETVLAHSGMFINGLRVHWPSSHAHAS